ncbi:MAG: cob(I)yrinic acid a,c-diamide adenosyltransferase [Saprospiraceae bacterium]
MKIYTKTGDTGQTALFGGRRVAKDELRIEAYGTVDELNACLGLLADHCPVDGDEHAAVRRIQAQLFSLGGSLASDPANRKTDGVVTVPAAWVEELETAIDAMNEALPALRHFILPGGHPAVSYAHLARTVCRRAERRCVTLDRAEAVEATIITYLNRLSDYLFVLARALGQKMGVAEVKWVNPT